MNLKEKQAEMRQRMTQPEVAPQTVAAVPVAKSEPQVWVRKETVFSVHPNFSPESNAGEFLDALIQLCADPPEYLHPQDAVQYLYLLPLLKAFTGQLRPSKAMKTTTKVVADITIEELCCWDVMENWIHSYYGRGAVEAHPLLPHFALDAKQLILAHAYGPRHRRRYNGLEVEAMVKPELKERYNGHDLSLDRQFRSEFTRENRGARAKGIVPGNPIWLRRGTSSISASSVATCRRAGTRSTLPPARKPPAPLT